MLALFYDKETTGLPIWKEPSEHPDQPHIVQMVAKLIDTTTRRTVQSLDLIIKPDGWTIPDDTAEIHGITTEHALAVGVGEKAAVSMLNDLSAVADKRIAHNEQFDTRIMRIALKRYFGDEAADAWKQRPAECTMRMSTNICNLRGTHAGKNKWPRLTEAYEFFMGEPMADAHTAMGDVNGCIAVYFAIQDFQAGDAA